MTELAKSLSEIVGQIDDILPGFFDRAKPEEFGRMAQEIAVLAETIPGASLPEAPGGVLLAVRLSCHIDEFRRYAKEHPGALLVIAQLNRAIALIEQELEKSRWYD